MPPKVCFNPSQCPPASGPLAAESLLPPTPLQVWLLTLRLRTLPAAVVPVMVGTALAAADHRLHWGRASTALVCALLIQIGTNLFNDYADFKRGADTAERLGPARASQRGWLAPQAVKRAAIGAFAAAAVAGAGLVWAAGWPILWVGLLSIAMGFCYTGGPYPLAYHGLGELFVFVFFGLVAVCGTYHVQALAPVPILVVAAAISVGLLASAILVVNNLRDRHTDAQAGKMTLAVRLGGGATQALYVLLLLAAYAPPLWVFVSGRGAVGWLLPLLSLPLAAFALRAIYRWQGTQLNVLLARTAQLEMLFGVLLSVGVLW